VARYPEGRPICSRQATSSSLPMERFHRYMDQARARPLPDKKNDGAPDNAGASAADWVAVDTELGMERSGRWREVGRARLWSVQFGGCVFSGDFDGVPLVRTGSCATEGGSLDLMGRGITALKSDSFADMGACR